MFYLFLLKFFTSFMAYDTKLEVAAKQECSLIEAILGPNERGICCTVICI